MGRYARITITLHARPVVAWSISDNEQFAEPIVADLGSYDDSRIQTYEMYGESKDQERVRRVLIPAAPGHYMLLVSALGSTAEEVEHEPGAGTYIVGLQEHTDWPHPVVEAKSPEEALKSAAFQETGEMYADIALERYGAFVQVKVEGEESVLTYEERKAR
jgi:hypothetical protein